MNIPDEAAKRYPNTDEHWTGWIDEERQQSFIAGAEWARREALREDIEAVEKRYLPAGRYNDKVIEAVAQAIRDIRALAEGGDNG